MLCHFSREGMLWRQWLHKYYENLNMLKRLFLDTLAEKEMSWK